MNKNERQVLEMLTIPQLAREVGNISPNGLRKVLERHEITGDAVLVEAEVRSELFLRARLPQLKQIIQNEKK